MKVPERPPVDTAHVAAGAAIDAVTQTIPGDQQVAAAGVTVIDLRSRRVRSIAPNVFEAGSIDWAPAAPPPEDSVSQPPRRRPVIGMRRKE